jgi:AraC-like DNA-binding protein
LKLNIRYENPIPMNVFIWSPKPYLQPLHTHTSLEIGCCLQGAGHFYFGEKRYSVKPGDVFIVNHMEPHIAESDPSKPSVYLFLNFEPDIVRQESLDLLLPFAYRPEHFDNRISAEMDIAIRIRTLMEKLHEEFTTRRDGYVTMAKSLLFQLCVELKRYRFGNSSVQDLNRMTKGFRRLQPALELIAHRYADPLELEDVAAVLCLRPSTAGKLFIHTTGRSWRSHLTEYRMREAKRLLTATDLPVAEIGYQSGFQSLPTFYRLFHGHVGVSPLDYRSSFGEDQMGMTE